MDRLPAPVPQKRTLPGATYAVGTPTALARGCAEAAEIACASSMAPVAEAPRPPPCEDEICAARRAQGGVSGEHGRV